MRDFAALLQQLDNGSLKPNGFSHAAHIGVTVQALIEGDFYDAHGRIARGLQRLTQTAGVPEKFNATLTFAWVSLIAQRLEPGQGPSGFLEQNPDILRLNPMALYPDGQAMTALARRVPVLPTVP